MTKPTARQMSGETKPDPATDLSLWCYMHPKEAAGRIRDAEAAFEHLSRSYAARTTEAQEINELRAIAESKLAKAHEVIRPFAEAADDLDDAHADHSSIWEAPAAMNIRGADLRAARVFMEKK